MYWSYLNKLSHRCLKWSIVEAVTEKILSVRRQYLCCKYTRKTGLMAAHNFQKLTAKLKSIAATSVLILVVLTYPIDF